MEQSGYALEFTMLLFLAILIVNVVGIRCVWLLFYLFLLKNCVDFTPIASQRILQRQSEQTTRHGVSLPAASQRS